MTPTEISDTQVSEWRNSPYPYKRFAAVMALWAREQPRGTPLPSNDEFAGDMDVQAGAESWRHAKQFLGDLGVLHRENGPHSPWLVS